MPQKDLNLNFIQILLRDNLIDKDKLLKIILQSKRSGRPVEEIIREKKLLKEEDILKIKSELLNIPSIDLTGQRIPAKIINIIPKELAENYRAVAFAKKGKELSVALVDPTNLKAREAVEFIARENGLKVKYFITSLDSFREAMKMYGGVASEVEKALKIAKQRMRKTPRALEVTGREFGDIIKSAPISKMVDIILKQAIENRASDIHIEPLFRETRVRYRIDGILHTFFTLPKYIHAALVSRVKVLANLKIDETRIPQDGRFRKLIDEEEYDFRVSTLPLVENEKVVIRLLETAETAPTLEELGFSGRSLEVMKEKVKSARGIFLTTGPTGCGKTTTLYSILSKLNREEVNIITLEDPIEYYLRGVSQSQINPAAGFTFATGLRSVLRQDPDIIMVGEIRDNETAALSIHAGLTGHIVLSTLHTNDSFGAIPRLIDMKVEPFLITSTLNVVVAQRLVRKICDNCKVEEDVSPVVKEKIAAKLAKIPNLKSYWSGDLKHLKFYKGKGCSLCNYTGYKGRTAITEVFAVTDELRKIILQGYDMDKVKKEFRRQGMVTMEEDGIIKALKGITTLEEVMRVTKQ